MSEARYNPFADDWVMIADNRQSRPDMPVDWCPFCPGSGKVPDDYDVFSFDNDFPVLVQEWSDASAQSDPFFQSRGTYGKCEVILYHPDHTTTLPHLSVGHIRKLVDLWCSRFAELAKDPDIRYVYIFENRGKEAGVTMPHPHGQLYAFGWIPKLIQTELDVSRKHLEKTGECLVCATCGKEREAGVRMVCENESFAAYVPFYTAWPYGVNIVAKRHTPNMLDMDAQQKDDLADIVRNVTGAYDALFDKPFPYMMGMHQTPVNTSDADDCYHFHMEFYPPLRASDRQYFRASCETGAGAYCNVTLPEESAAVLREALARYRAQQGPDSAE